jgi:hypothetical protein
MHLQGQQYVCAGELVTLQTDERFELSESPKD